MRFALMTEPQMGLTYADQLAVVQRAEAAGFEAFFRSDHYESFPGETDQPTTDAWAVLAGLARDTTRIGLGVLVSPVTFRTPGNLAKVAVTVDEMSGGRVEVGRRRRLARERAPAPRLPVPADRGAGRHARGDARDPARPVGGARTAGRSSARTTRSRTRSSARSRRRCRVATDGRSGSSPAAQGSPARVPDRRPLRRRVQPLVDLARRRDDEVREARRRLPGDRPRPVDARPLGDGRAAHRPDAGRGQGSRAGGPRRVRRARTRTARSGSTRAGRAGSTGRRTRRVAAPAVRRGGRPAAHAPGLPRRATST